MDYLEGIVICVSVIGLPITIIGFIFLIASSFNYRFESKPDQLKRFPRIAIIVAMRNEEQNIESCLKSLLALDYPEDKFRILVGNDDSTDNSKQVVEQIKQRYPKIELFDIPQDYTTHVGKQNVLSFLGDQVNEELIAFADADVEVNPNWLKALASHFEEGTVQIVTGVTTIGNATYQNMDWLYALGMVKTVSDLEIPVTAMGNNMMVRKSAYDKVGGYRSLPSSIVEDFDFFHFLLKEFPKGFRNLFDTNSHASTKGIKGLGNLLMQRKRWMKGAMKLVWPIKTLLIFNSLFYVIVIALAFFQPRIANWFFWIKFSMQGLYIGILLVKLKQRVSIFSFLTYEIYSVINTLLLFIVYLLPIKINWKGRQY